MILNRNQLLHRFVNSLYSRTELELAPSRFRVKGDTVDIFPPYMDTAFRIIFFDDEIESIAEIEPISGDKLGNKNELTIYPANIFVTSQQVMNEAIEQIQLDLGVQVDYFRSIGKHLEAKRLEDRVTYDVEMMKELGYCRVSKTTRYLITRCRRASLLHSRLFPEDFI